MLYNETTLGNQLFTWSRLYSKLSPIFKYEYFTVCPIRDTHTDIHIYIYRKEKERKGEKNTIQYLANHDL